MASLNYAFVNFLFICNNTSLNCRRVSVLYLLYSHNKFDIWQQSCHTRTCALRCTNAEFPQLDLDQPWLDIEHSHCREI